MHSGLWIPDARIGTCLSLTKPASAVRCFLPSWFQTEKLTFAALERDESRPVSELLGTRGSFSELRTHSCIEEILLRPCANNTTILRPSQKKRTATLHTGASRADSHSCFALSQAHYWNIKMYKLNRNHLEGWERENCSAADDQNPPKKGSTRQTRWMSVNWIGFMWQMKFS